MLRALSGFYTVVTDEGDLIEARMRGRVKRERQSSDLAVIGDRVELDRLPDGTGAIVAVEPRERRFSRRQPGPRGTWREDVIVANADLVAIVFACDRPPPNPRLIDRFLVVAEYNEVPAILVANKTDLVGVDAARERFGDYERIGYDVLYTSAKARLGLEDLRERLAGRLSIVTGPSGVGKSTLLNAMQPGLRLVTGDVARSSTVEAATRRRTRSCTRSMVPPADTSLTLPASASWVSSRFRDELACVSSSSVSTSEVCLRRLLAPARAAVCGPRCRRSRGDLA